MSSPSTSDAHNIMPIRMRITPCTNFSSLPLLGAGWHATVYAVNATATLRVVRAGSQLARRRKFSAQKEAHIRRSNPTSLLAAAGRCLGSGCNRSRFEASVVRRELAIARLMGENKIGPHVLGAAECSDAEAPPHGRYFAAITERMDGDLHEWLANSSPRTPLEREEAYEKITALLTQMRDSLHLAHEDLVPRNIMYKVTQPTNAGDARVTEWRLIDFGLAYSLDASGPSNFPLRRWDRATAPGCTSRDRTAWCANPAPTLCYWAAACGWGPNYSCGGPRDAHARAWLQLVLLNRGNRTLESREHCAIGGASRNPSSSSGTSSTRSRHRSEMLPSA